MYVLCYDDVQILPPLGNSDHSIVSFKLFTSLPPPTAQANSDAPNFSKADWPGLCCYLSAVNWQSEFSGCVSVNEYWDTFVHFVSKGIDDFVPKYKRTKHAVSSKLYPRYVRKLFAKKNVCWKLYKQFKNDALYAKYKRVANLCTKAIIEYNTNIENSLVSDGRIGCFYKHANKKN